MVVAQQTSSVGLHLVPCPADGVLAYRAAEQRAERSMHSAGVDAGEIPGD